MATSRYQGHCRTSALEDDGRDDAVIIPQTASVTPLVGNIPLTPPRKLNQVLGLVTPLATPDSQLRPNSSEIRFTSPPHTPVRRPDIPKDTKLLTISGNPSEWSSDQSTVPFLLLTGLLTPDNTPPRLSKPRSVPIDHKEETTDKSESSRSLEITPTVKISETSELYAKVIQNTRTSEPVTTQCNGITKKTKRRCFKSVKAPNRYCVYHIDQDTGPPSNSSVSVRGPHRLESQDTATKPTTDVNSQCQRSVKPPAQYCHQHGYKSNNIPTTSIAPQPTTEVNSQCHELTLHGIQCRLPVTSSVQSYYQHGYQSNNAPTTPIAPTLTIEVNSRCHGLTLRGIQCRRPIKPPAQYCYQHESKSTNTPTAPTSPKPATDVNSQCCGLTLRGVQCRRSVKPPAQYCHQHGSQSTSTPTTPTAPKPTTDVNSQCRELALRDVQCQSQGNMTPTVRSTVQCNAKSKSKGRRCKLWVSIIPGQLTKDSSQPIYCRYHIPALVGIMTHVANEGFKVQPVGREEVFVRFCDYIPEYLQPDTRQRLRNAITRDISERFRIPGYVYALNVFDPEIEGKLSLKIGYSNDVKKRHAEWRNKCRSSIRDVRGWWPGTIIEAKDDDKMSIQELIGNNRQGAKGPMAEHLERLVHIELNDLATHAPYLHPNFPDVHFSDIPRLPKADPKPCRDCNGTKHQEVFSFTRVKEGEFFGREWEDIIKPVIRKWGLFLMEYFAPS